MLKRGRERCELVDGARTPPYVWSGGERESSEKQIQNLFVAHPKPTACCTSFEATSASRGRQIGQLFVHTGRHGRQTRDLHKRTRQAGTQAIRWRRPYSRGWNPTRHKGLPESSTSGGGGGGAGFPALIPSVSPHGNTNRRYPRQKHSFHRNKSTIPPKQGEAHPSMQSARVQATHNITRRPREHGINGAPFTWATAPPSTPARRCCRPHYRGTAPT